MRQSMHNPPAARRVRLGMTLVELLLAAGVLTVAMTLLVATANAVRTTNAHEQTRQTLRMLRQALNQYQQHHHAWPAGERDAALLTLLADDASAGTLRGVPITTDGRRYAHVLDGYGRMIRYEAPGPDRYGRPDFLSAGPDGIFGDPTSSDLATAAAASDNIYGADTEGMQP